MAVARQVRWCQPGSWIQRRVREQWTTKAREEGYRARSAYKLQQIDDEFKLFKGTTKCVVDLGCAPGSWLQVAAERMDLVHNPSRLPRHRKHVIGIDLMPVDPIPGVTILQGDFRSREIQNQVYAQVNTAATEMGIPTMAEESSKEFRMSIWESENTPAQTGDLGLFHHGRKSDVCLNHRMVSDRVRREPTLSFPAVDGVICDMAAHNAHVQNLGSQEREEQLKLADMAKTFAVQTLKKDGFFVTKVFMCDTAQKFFQATKLYFRYVNMVRPPAVQRESREAFVVARGFIGRERLTSHEYFGLEAQAIKALGDTGMSHSLRKSLGISRGRDPHNVDVIPGYSRQHPTNKPKLLRNSARIRKTLPFNRGSNTDLTPENRNLLAESVPRTI